MKTTIQTDILKTTLAKLTAPPGEQPVQIGTLAVVITASEFDGITLRRTTANANITIAIDGRVDEEGECAVDCGLLAAALAGFAAKEVSLSSDNDAIANKETFNLQIAAGKSRATLQCFNPEDVLAPMPAPAAITKLDFLTTDLDGALSTAAPAAADDPNKPHLSGVCIRTQRGQATLFAVDGRRFHLRFTGPRAEPIYPHEGKDMGAMIPGAAVVTLKKLISGPEAKIGLEIADGAIRAHSGQMCAILPLLAKAPPHLEAVLPWDDEPEQWASCDRAELLRLVRACVPMGSYEDKIITVKFAPDAVVIEADSGRGAVGHEIEAETSVEMRGEKLYRIKASWFAEMLDHSAGESVKLEYHSRPGSAPLLATRAEDRLLCVLLTRDLVAAQAAKV